MKSLKKKQSTAQLPLPNTRGTYEEQAEKLEVTMSGLDIERLSHCCKVLRLTKDDVVRIGISKVFETADDEAAELKSNLEREKRINAAEIKRGRRVYEKAFKKVYQELYGDKYAELISDPDYTPSDARIDAHYYAYEAAHEAAQEAVNDFWTT